MGAWFKRGCERLPFFGIEGLGLGPVNKGRGVVFIFGGFVDM